jgi:hypothetical protein
MPWSGGVFTQTNGVYTGATIWNSDKNAGTLITSAHHDTHDYDVAQGVNQCVNKDGSNTVTLLSLSGTVNSTSGIINIGGVTYFQAYGTGNLFIGSGAGNFTLTGISNVGIGNNALNAATTAASNCALGVAAMLDATTGAQNVSIGAASCHILTTGSNNTAVGFNSLSLTTTGSDNVAVGSGAVTAISTGSQNVGIGYLVQVPDGTASGQLVVQNAIYGVSNTATATTVSSGNIGFYTKAPTARVHLPAGTASAGSAPLKLTSGTVLGTPEDGAFEYDGTHLYFTHGVTRVQIL